MSTVATAPTSPSVVQEKFSKGPGFVGTLIFIAVLGVGISYIGWSLSRSGNSARNLRAPLLPVRPRVVCGAGI